MDKKDAASMEELMRLAEAGNAAAQQWVALAFMEGWGVDLDYERARDWYAKAAEKDDPGGHFGLAVLHLFGQGLRQDPVEAYMRLFLMKRKRRVLSGRWGAETTRRMLDTVKQLEAKLSVADREEGQRRAEEWQWQRKR